MPANKITDEKAFDLLVDEFNSRLKISEKARDQAISQQLFFEKIKELESAISSIEQEKESEPEERVERANMVLPQIKTLELKLDSVANFSDLNDSGGLTALRIKANPALLSLQARASDIVASMAAKKVVSPLSNPKNSEVVVKGMTLFSQLYKVRKAYQGIYSGRKYKKVVPVKKDENPIKALSEKNLKALKQKLQVGLKADIETGKLKETNLNSFGLKPDEIDLFAALLNLPYKMQHATNHFAEIANAGRLNSLTEIHRHNPTFDSPFTTPGNLTELGNGGFVFFRVYVEGTNGEQTRYGNTRVTSDISVLRDIGWISLHDQLVPFSNKRRKQVFYVNKRLLFTAEPTSIKNKAQANKSADALKYTYRVTPITSYNAGTQDKQKDFGKKIKTKTETISFTDEIFYAGDILPGIALSIIYRLRQLEACGYRAVFLRDFIQTSTRLDQRELLLGELVKDLYRIEGKYPTGLQIQYNSNNNQCFFKPIAGSDSERRSSDCEIIVENPDGDGRLNIDLSMNTENARLAYYTEKLKSVTEQIVISQKHPNDDTHQKKLVVLKNQKIELEKELTKFTKEKLGFIKKIQKACPDEDCSWLDKRSYEFLKLLANDWLLPLEEAPSILAELRKLSTRKLAFMTYEDWFELLERDYVNLEQLIMLDEKELQEMIWQNLLFAIVERDCDFDELVELYRNNKLLFEIVTCEDLTDLAFSYAPNIPKEFMKYADEVDFGFIRYNLKESDQVLFDMNFSNQSENSEETEEVFSEDQDDEDANSECSLEL